MKKVIETALKRDDIEFMDVSPDAIYVPSMGVVVTFHPVKDVTVETESGLKFSVVPTGPAKTARKPTISKPKVSKPKAAPPSPPTPKEERPKPKKEPKLEEPIRTTLSPGDALDAFLRGLTRSQVWSGIELVTDMEVKQAIPDLVIPCKTDALITGFINMLRTKGFLEKEHAIIAEIKNDLEKKGKK